MTPFNPNALSYIWFLRWREHVRCARAIQHNGGFCRAAVNAQAIHVIELACERYELRKAGLLKDD